MKFQSSHVLFACLAIWVIVSTLSFSRRQTRPVIQHAECKACPCAPVINTTTPGASNCPLGAVLLVRVYARDKARLTFAHLLQWMWYMKYAGVERFYIYDAYEQPDERLQYLVQHIPGVVYKDWSSTTPYEMIKTQVSAYQDAINTFGHECDWQTAMDIDEYPLSATDTEPGFFARYLQQKSAHVAEISMSNYLQVGPANFDERLWLGERYPRRTKEPGNNLVKPAYRPNMIAAASLHHNNVKDGGSVETADAGMLRMAHVWGARISDFKEEMSQDLLEKTVECNLLASVVQRVKVWP